MDDLRLPAVDAADALCHLPGHSQITIDPTGSSEVQPSQHREQGSQRLPQQRPAAKVVIRLPEKPWWRMTEANVHRPARLARVVAEGAAARNQEVAISDGQRGRRGREQGQRGLQSRQGYEMLQKARSPGPAAHRFQRHNVAAVGGREQRRLRVAPRQEAGDTLGAAKLGDVVMDNRGPDRYLPGPVYQAPRIETTAATVRTRIARSIAVERRAR